MGNETNLNDLPKNDLIQIILCHGPFLILTQQEFQQAIRRGESVVHNRFLKNRPLDLDTLSGELIEDER